MIRTVERLSESEIERTVLIGLKDAALQTRLCNNVKYLPPPAPPLCTPGNTVAQRRRSLARNRRCRSRRVCRRHTAIPGHTQMHVCSCVRQVLRVLTLTCRVQHIRNASSQRVFDCGCSASRFSSDLPAREHGISGNDLARAVPTPQHESRNAIVASLLASCPLTNAMPRTTWRHSSNFVATDITTLSSERHAFITQPHFCKWPHCVHKTLRPLSLSLKQARNLIRLIRPVCLQSQIENNHSESTSSMKVVRRDNNTCAQPVDAGRERFAQSVDI